MHRARNDRFWSFRTRSHIVSGSCPGGATKEWKSLNRSADCGRPPPCARAADGGCCKTYGGDKTIRQQNANVGWPPIPGTPSSFLEVLHVTIPLAIRLTGTLLGSLALYLHSLRGLADRKDSGRFSRPWRPAVILVRLKNPEKCVERVTPATHNFVDGHGGRHQGKPSASADT